MKIAMKNQKKSKNLLFLFFRDFLFGYFFYMLPLALLFQMRFWCKEYQLCIVHQFQCPFNMKKDQIYNLKIKLINYTFIAEFNLIASYSILGSSRDKHTSLNLNDKSDLRSCFNSFPYITK
jgi:hypothetical protein